MSKFKFVVFVEFIAIFVCGAMHLFMFLTEQEFSLLYYPLIAGIVLISLLLVVYVFHPLAECWNYYKN